MLAFHWLRGFRSPASVLFRAGACLQRFFFRHSVEITREGWTFRFRFFNIDFVSTFVSTSFVMDPAKKQKVDEPQPGPSSSTIAGSSTDDDVPLAARRKDAKGKVKKSTNVQKQQDSTEKKVPKGKVINTTTEKKVPKGKVMNTPTESKVPKGKESEEAGGSANVASDDGNESEEGGDLQLSSDEASQGWSLTKRRRAMKVM